MKNSSKTPCPDPEAFVGFFLNEAGPAEREAFLDHILDCSSCRVQFEILKGVGREFRCREGELSRSARASWKELRAQERGTRSAWAAFKSARWATSCLLAVGLLAAAYFVFLRPASRDVLRSAEKPQLRLVEPKGQIPKPPAVFKWTPVQKAEGYRLRLIDASLQTIIRLDGIREISYSVPSDVQSKLAKGKPYIWTVEAYDDLGLKLDSGRQHFEIE